MPVPVSASSRTGRPAAVSRTLSRSVAVRGPATGTVSVRASKVSATWAGDRYSRRNAPNWWCVSGLTAPVMPVRSPASYVDPTADPGERQALGVDELQRPGVRCRGGDLGRHGQRDQAAGPLEPGQPEGAVRQQLQVVELAGGGTVLGYGWLVGHRARMPHAGRAAATGSTAYPGRAGRG